MADFELEVDFKAATGKLEQGAKRSEQIVQRTADRIEQEVGDANESFDGMLGLIGKVAAGLFLLEGAMKLGSAAARGLAGDTESMNAALGSLPILGPLITSVQEFQESLDYVSDSATRQREKIEELRIEYEFLDAAVARASHAMDLHAQTMKLLGRTDEQITLDQFGNRMKLADETHRLALRAIEEEHNARVLAIEEQDMGYEAEQRVLRDIYEEKVRSIHAAEDELAARKILLKTERDVAEVKLRDDRINAERAANQKRAQEMAEQHQKDMIALEKERIEETKKRAEEEAKALKAQQDFAGARFKMEKELGDARKQAEQSVAGATASFSTAGGSFVTGVAAQVDETKLLKQISQQSRDFLEQIVQNTAGLGVMGFA